MDQLTNSGGAFLAARLRAATADHLEQTNTTEIAALGEAGVQPVLLPASVYALGKTRYPKARAMIPEFIGRLPVLTALDALTEEEMVMILTDTKNAMIKQYTKLFAMEGVRLTVTKDALRALAAQAVTKGTGARALRSMLERIMLDIMYDVPSREDIAEVTINRAVVEGKKVPLIRKKQDKDAA